MSVVFRLLAALALVTAIGCHRGYPPGPGPNPARPTGSNELLAYSWVLRGVNGQPVGMGDQGRQATIRFLANGSAAGFGGCTNYRVTYTVDGEKLHFSPLTTARPTCSAGTSLERDFLRAVGRVRGWRITDSRLELFDPDGNTILDFDRR